MALPLSPAGWVSALKREWGLHQLQDEAWRHLWQPPPPDEWVALRCQTTGFDVQQDQITAIAAVPIVGSRLLTSQRLWLPVLSAGLGASDHRGLPFSSWDAGRAEASPGALPLHEALAMLLQCVGARPLVGYYLQFDLAMLNRALLPLLGVPLPQPAIEVSALFHDWKFRQLAPHQQQGNVTIDLRFATLLRELGLPVRDTRQALDHAVMAGLAFTKLRRLTAGD